MAEKNNQAARWVFTINNYPSDWEDRLIPELQREGIQYLIIGKEVGKEGTPHLQGYVRFISKKYRQHLKSNISPEFYGFWDVARGSEKSNYDYCSKQNDFIEIGERAEAVNKSLEKNERYRAIMNDWLSLSPIEFDAKWPMESLMLRQKLRQWEADRPSNTLGWDGDLKEKNFWIWGVPGTGKSRWVRNQADKLNTFVYAKGANKWWGGYDPKLHRIVLFEDFPEDGKYLAQLMKIWADRYSFTGEIKGSSVPIEPGRFYLCVTSNYSIDQTFGGVDTVAIKRRFTEVEINDQWDIWLSTNLKPIDFLLK